MDGLTALRSRLAELDEAGLLALLERRPDVLAGAAPSGLTDLALRLWHPHSIQRHLRLLPLPALHLLEAAQALGERCTRTTLTDLLAGSGSKHRAAVRRVLGELTDDAVVAPDGPQRIVLPDAIGDIFPEPLRLGPPLAELLKGQSARQTRSARDLAADPDAVRALVAAAPPEVRTVLLDRAAGRSDPRDRYDPVRYRLRIRAEEWAAQNGLLVGSPFAGYLRMPAEIALTLRGPEYRAPFLPDAPPVPTTPVDRTVLGRHCAAAAGAFHEQLLSVLDHVARAPVPALKSGGIGARELAKLGKATGVDDPVVRLVLELAGELGLLAGTESAVAVSHLFAEWRDEEPAERYGAVLATWWAFAGTPTQSRDADGKAMRALAGARSCEGCRAARGGLLKTLAGLRGRAARPHVVASVLWHRPLVHVLEQDGDDPFATGWHEAEIVGVLADGALTELGRALVDGADLAPVARTLLPAATDRASFGSDLTAFVVGVPSRRVSGLLDSAAERESRGGATTWRFSTGSIRRAFDDGATTDGLTAALGDIATGPLPQPLSYLIADVARRHGNLRLVPATSCIRSDDTALLAEVAADRKLAKYRLRLLAPTVLVSELPLAALLDVLRAAGYFPLAEDRQARPTTVAAARPTPAARRPTQRVLPSHDPRTVAAALARAPVDDQGVDFTPTEEEIAGLAPALSLAEIRQLAHAVDTSSRVRIEYVASTGGSTDRVIQAPDLVAGSLFAWCELRSAERVFSVSRIQRVTAV